MNQDLTLFYLNDSLFLIYVGCMRKFVSANVAQLFPQNLLLKVLKVYLT